MKEIWDNRYNVTEFVYGVEPNSIFKKFLETKPKLRVLLPGEGEGRNALFAAKNECCVHAFDQSVVAAAKAVNLAGSHGLSIEYQICSCEEFIAPENYYDAIGLIFLHIPKAVRKDFHNNIISSLIPGGRIIAELFSTKQIEMNSGGPKNIELLYSPDEIKDDFSDFNFILFEEKQIELHEGSLHNGLAWVIRFVGEKKTLVIEESSN